MINKKEFEFSSIHFILGCLFFFLIFSALHVYWLGEPFETFLSILITLYLGVCTWAYSYIHGGPTGEGKGGRKIDVWARKARMFYKAFWVIIYIIAPFLYLYFKFFDNKE